MEAEKMMADYENGRGRATTRPPARSRMKKVFGDLVLSCLIVVVTSDAAALYPHVTPIVHIGVLSLRAHVVRTLSVVL